MVKVFNSNQTEYIKKQIHNKSEIGEWYKIIYEQRTKRFIADNYLIWYSGSILIPLSLSPFVVYVTLEDPKVWQLSSLAFVSVIMILSWNVIAERQRKFQNEHLEFLDLIHTCLNIENTSNSNGQNLIRIFRLYLVVFYTCLWLWLIFLNLKIVDIIISTFFWLIELVAFMFFSNL